MELPQQQKAKSPSDEEAHAFATMLLSGLSAGEAILYFVENDDPTIIRDTLNTFQRSRKVKAAILKLQGKAWHLMTDDERARTALSTHYNQLAAFLNFNNYSELNQAEKSKADTARTALETKLAGQAGKGDPLSRFLEDLNSGRLKLTDRNPQKIFNIPQE